MTLGALSDSQLDAFRAHGWFVAPAVFSEAECAELLREIDQVAFELALGDPSDGQLSYRPMMHLLSAPLTAAATDARWAPIVLGILGTSARLYWEQAVAKPPFARTELPWHQDNGYTPIVPEEYVTCWLALDDADENNGCIWVLPDSHRAGTVRHRNGTGPFRVADTGGQPGIPVPVRAGDVLVFSSLLLHRSGPNITDRPRRAWIIQFCAAEAASELSGAALDDRLLVARDGRWLDEPVRERPIDLGRILANYDQR